MSIPKSGDQRWSEYFKAWVTLVNFTDDDHWSFTTPKFGDKELRAQTKWSTMGTAKPEPVSRS